MFAAKSELFISSSRSLPHAGKHAPWGTLLCVVASDLLSLTLVITLLVGVRHILDPRFAWSTPLPFSAFSGAYVSRVSDVWAVPRSVDSSG